MRRAAVLLSAALLALAACGGDDHPEDHAEESDAAQSTTSASGTDSTEPGGAGPPEDDGEHAHDSASFPAAEATDIAKISLRDYVFVDVPASVTGPKLRIEAKNNGPSAHEILAFDADGNEVGGSDPVASGESSELSLELTAGTYELRCQIAISESETHLDRGMRVTFAVM